MFEENAKAVTEISGAEFLQADTNRFVTKSTVDGRVTKSAANALAYGVMTTAQPIDGAGRVVIDGIVPVVAGTGGVVQGTPCGAGADGTAVTAATTKLAIPVVSGAEGTIVPMKLLLTATAGA